MFGSVYVLQTEVGGQPLADQSLTISAVVVAESVVIISGSLMHILSYRGIDFLGAVVADGFRDVVLAFRPGGIEDVAVLFFISGNFILVVVHLALVAFLHKTL